MSGSAKSHELTFARLFALLRKISVINDSVLSVPRQYPHTQNNCESSCFCCNNSEDERLSWYIANYVYPTSGEADSVSSAINWDFQRKKYRLQHVARQVLDGGKWRVHDCCWKPVASSVTVNYAQEFKRAHYGGLATCGSVWVCPVCSVKIAARRGIELAEAVPASGLTPILVTYTIQHKRYDLLDKLMTDLTSGIRYSLSGAAKKRFFEKFGIVGYVTSLEIRHGRSGWHPHKHRLFLSNKSPGELNSAEIEKSILSRYGRYLKKNSYRVNQHTVDIQVVQGESGAAVEKYMTKWSVELELTGAALKTSRAAAKSRSPFQLLDAYDSGDLDAGVLFIEYCESTKGKRQLQYSDGLRKFLGLGEQKSDEEVASEQDEYARLMSMLTPSQWYRLRRQRGLITECLHVASFGDGQVLREFLRMRGVID